MPGRTREEMLEWSTALPEKRELYVGDTYFVEALEDVGLQPDTELRTYLLHHTFVLLKPETLLLHREREILHWLATHDWECVAALPVQIGRHELHGLWRYQWNAATRHYRDLYHLLFAQSASLLLIIRSGAGHQLSAAERFAREKGPAAAHKREGGELRAALGAYSSYLNFIHSPDEPADVLRELGVMLAPEARRRVTRAGLTPVPEPVILAQAARLVEDLPPSPPCGADLESARKHLVAECVRLAGPRSEVAERIAAADVAGSEDWHDLQRELASLDPAVARSFAFTIFASYFTVSDMEGRERHLPTMRGKAPTDPGRLTVLTEE